MWTAALTCGSLCLTERRTETVTGICQHTAEAHADRYQAIILSPCVLGFAGSSIFGRNTSSPQPPPSLTQLSGRKCAMPPSPELRRGRASLTPKTVPWRTCSGESDSGATQRPRTSSRS